MIAAQDSFFADRSVVDAKATLVDLARNIEDGNNAKAEISAATIAGRAFARLDIQANPLSRIVFATNIRCHAVIFVFASPDHERLTALAASLNHLSLPAAPTAPVCVKDYTTAQTIRHRVEPTTAGPQFVKVPVRMIIGSDGKVKHIHVIRADPAQRRSIVDALAQWQFEPDHRDGRAAAVETGLTFEFKPTRRAD